MKTDRINIAEDFLSIQGEGPTVGYPSLFIRLGGCNLLCGGKGTIKDKGLHDGATWRCDTIEVWSKSKSWVIDEYVYELQKKYNLVESLSKGTHIVITGGEPFMQSRAIDQFLDAVYSLYYQGTKTLPPPYLIEFETNGTLWDEWVESFAKTGHQFNVSPKLASSGESLEKRFVENNLIKFSKLSNSFFKFVATTDVDLLEIKEFFDFIPRTKIYLMPGASNVDDLKKNSIWLVKKCLENNYKFSSRLQVAIWNEVTGV